jgi:hypothetical protein
MTQSINWYNHKKNAQSPSMSPKATFPQQNSTDANEISAIARTGASLTDPNSQRPHRGAIENGKTKHVLLHTKSRLVVAHKSRVVRD